MEWERIRETFNLSTYSAINRNILPVVIAIPQLIVVILTLRLCCPHNYTNYENEYCHDCHQKSHVQSFLLNCDVFVNELITAPNGFTVVGSWIAVAVLFTGVICKIKRKCIVIPLDGMITITVTQRKSTRVITTWFCYRLSGVYLLYVTREGNEEMLIYQEQWLCCKLLSAFSVKIVKVQGMSICEYCRLINSAEKLIFQSHF